MKLELRSSPLIERKRNIRGQSNCWRRQKGTGRLEGKLSGLFASRKGAKKKSVQLKGKISMYSACHSYRDT